MEKTKNFFAIICVLMMAVGVLGACGKKEEANANYLEWTAEDWNSASDDEKKACVVEYAKYAAEDVGTNVTMEDVNNLSEAEKDIMVSTLDALFAVSGGDRSIKEWVDAGMATIGQ